MTPQHPQTAAVEFPANNEPPHLHVEGRQVVEHFDAQPFLVSHDLCGHPLFTLPRLLQLAQVLPPQQVEYNAGNLALVQDPRLTPLNGLSITETIQRIAECQSWMVLKNVERDPVYAVILRECLEGIRHHIAQLGQEMQLLEAFIFVTSPGSITPYHIDPEHNFLLQIQGEKTIQLYDGRDRSLLSEQELEELACGAHRNLSSRDPLPPPNWQFCLQPGMGLYFPPTYPHLVRNGDQVSISFSVTFRTPDLERRTMVRTWNAALRRYGGSPAPVGKHPRRDACKYFWFRAWRRTRRLLGLPDHTSRSYGS